MKSTNSNRLLRRALLGNAAFSTVTGLSALIAAPQISEWMGNAEASPWIFSLGPMLLCFAAFVSWVATRDPIHPKLALAISIADFGWVLGSAGLVLWTPNAFSFAGWMVVGVVALMVLVFAEAQLLGLGWKPFGGKASRALS